jgi:YbgC/YbaW family acyl-CoA thioester hydrolase
VGAPLVHTLRVRYGESDLQGIAFNAHYLNYFDIGMTELLRAAHGSYQSMLERGVDIVLAEARLRFRKPARFDDELDLSVAVTHLGTTRARAKPKRGVAARGRGYRSAGSSSRRRSASVSLRWPGQIPVRWWNVRALARSTAAPIAAIVAASRAAAPTTFGKLASSVVGLGGASESIRDHRTLKMLRAILAPISVAMIPNGL